METAPELLLLVACVVALIVGTALRQLCGYLRLPHSVVLLLCGLLLGSLARQGAFAELTSVTVTLDYLVHLDPHLILALFLPVLIFQSALALDPHLFKRLAGQISVLAVPGVVFSTLLTACLCKWLLPLDWGWPEALLMGALISATDPVAVVALLKETGTRHRLETLIEGESLLNDGAAIVLFMLFLSLLGSNDSQLPLLSSLGQFLLVVCGGGLIGWLVGNLVAAWMGQLFRAPAAQISLSVAAAYLSYLLAEMVLHVSGVVALVTLGLIFGARNRLILSPTTANFLSAFWALMAEMANTLIFLLVGLTIAMKTPLSTEMPWQALLMLFVGLILIRALMLLLFTPLLKLTGQFTWQKGLVLLWGALRGAIGLVLALSLLREGVLPDHVGQQILFLTAGVVVLTLLLNGVSMPLLMRWLGLDRLPEARQRAAHQVATLVESELEQRIERLSRDYLYQDVDWGSVRQQVLESQPHTNGLSCPLERRNREYFRQLLNEQKQCYWQLLEQGYIGKEAFRYLHAGLQSALDNEPDLAHFEHLQRKPRLPQSLSVLWSNGWLRRLLVRLRYRHLLIDYDMDRGFYSAQLQLQRSYAALAPDAAAAEQAKTAIENNLRQSHMRIESLRLHFPEVVHALETASASRVLLVAKMALLQQSLHDGVLDEKDAELRLRRALEQLDRLNRKPTSLTLPSLEERLMQLPLFAMLTPSQLQRLTRVAEHCYLAENELICKQGQGCQDLLLLLRGSAESIRRCEGAITEMKMLGAGVQISTGLQPKAGLTVRSMMAVELLRIPAAQVAELAAESPQFAKAVLANYFT